ncbi:MAG: HAMP domain-containing histidine kinase [Pseudomonadota bacterium]|nr:HAMP domain-containing histidine kinase [Pseudomonadota bacterium]
MSLNKRNIRVVFLLQLAILSLVLIIGILAIVATGRELPLGVTTFGATVLALGLLVAVTGMTYRATRRLMAPMDWLLREVARWNPQQPDTRALSPDRIPPEVTGDLRKMALALHDLGERVSAFVARERDFTRDASHELRTPLTVIRVATDLISHDESLSKLSRRSLARIQDANAAMESIMDALLLLARDQEVALEHEHFAVRGVVDLEVERIRPLLEGKEVQLDVEILAEPELHAPPRVLGVMLRNLLSNAARFTDTGHIRVRLLTDRIEVEDSGIGMDAATLARAFEPFYRIDATATGAGLGLSIAQRLGDRCGWPLQLTSTPGRGTQAAILFGDCYQVN